MKKLLLLFILFFFVTLSVKSQTIVYSENWTSGGTGWSLNVVTGAEGADPNFFTVSDNEGGGIAPGGCGVANNLNNTLHVTSVFNPTGGAAYDAGGLCGLLFCPQTNRRTESPTYSCAGLSTISVNFNYIEGGQGTNDDAVLLYFDGSTWSVIDNMPKTLVCGGGQGKWTARTVALPASANNNPNVKIAFGWVNNDDGVGTDPSFAVDDITLTVPSAATPVVTITPTTATTICAGSTVSLNGSATNTPTTWAWSSSPATGVTFNPSATSQNVIATFTNSGTYTLTLTATNAVGNGSSTQVITVNPSITPSVVITASPANPICSGTAITFTATPTNGGTTPTYQWQVNSVNVGGATNATYTNATLINNDVVSVIITSNAACSSPTTATDSYVVHTSVPVTPGVTIGAAPGTSICIGDNITFTATPINGGLTPAYQWQVNGANVSGATSSTFTPSSLTNNDQISVIMTSNAGCVTTAIANSSPTTITVTPTPTLAVVQGSATICPGSDTLIVSSTNATSFNWLPATSLNNNTNDTVIFSDNAIGTYTYVVTAINNGCSSASQTITVTVSNNLNATITGGNTLCAGDSTQLTVTGGTSWLWTPALGLSCTTCANPWAEPTTSTVYSVTATNGGCTAAVTQSIVVNQHPVAGYTGETAITGLPANVAFVNTSTNATSYVWNYGDSSPLTNDVNTTHTYAAEGTYTVTLVAVNALGCPNDTLRFTVTVTDFSSIIVPNIFSPNGDNINETFQVVSKGITSLTCEIFDRWGLKMGGFDQVNGKWDGHTTSGNKANEGTYYYYIKASGKDGKDYNLKGYVQLVH